MQVGVDIKEKEKENRTYKPSDFFQVMLWKKSLKFGWPTIDFKNKVYPIKY